MTNSLKNIEKLVILPTIFTITKIFRWYICHTSIDRVYVMKSLKDYFRPLYRKTISLIHRGDNVKCNCCGSSYSKMRTLKSGATGVCWLCGSYPRTRGMKIILEKILRNIPKPAKMLHIAPEVQLRDWLRNYSGLTYIAGDKRTEGYTYPDYVTDMDIMSLPFEDNSFDVVMCSHVLEHVFDDIKAMSEFRRVLKPDGIAIIQVPYNSDQKITDEEKESEHLTPQQRKQRFGQFDHVKTYGLDFFDRMSNCNLPVTLIKMSKTDCDTYALFDWEDFMVVNPLPILMENIE